VVVPWSAVDRVAGRRVEIRLRRADLHTEAEEEGG
jgi:hypothetical protein